MKSNMNKFPEPRMPANDNFIETQAAPKPETRAFLEEDPNEALLLNHERGIKNILNEIREAGDPLGLLTEEARAKAQVRAEGMLGKRAVRVVNITDETDWRNDPAFYEALLQIIDSQKSLPEEGG